MSDPDEGRLRSEKEIFFVALDKHTPEERAAFLDGACGTNPVQRARVEALLADHYQRDEFMKQPAVGGDVPERPAPTNAASQPKEATATMIGRYKLLEKIGEGGFGEVWMTEQREPVKRRVALKIIKLGMDSRQIVARFEAERQALAMMDHPNIARIFDAGVTDTGRPYFVMELVRGIKITEYCDQNQLPTRERLNLFIKVCQAIQHAHQKGIIHRDIKPSNILVTLHDGVPVPKVIDFGIAKATQQELTDKTVFTQFQQFVGTPAYISPEQAEMSGLDIDTRADIYSLGVLLYELLVGQTPFDPKEMLKGGLDALRRIIREQEPLRPSTRLNTLAGEDRTTAGKRRQTEVGRLVHQLQGDLDWIVMKCLEKDRTRRYDTANGLAMDIQRHLSCEPVLARPPGRLYEFQKTVRRHKFGFAATAAIIVVLAIGVTLTTRQAVRATRAEVLARQRLTESEAITEFLAGLFQSPDPARDGRSITVVETLGKAVKNLDRGLGNEPARRAKLQLTLGRTYTELGMPLEAIPLLEQARDYYLAVSGQEHMDTLNAMHQLAISLRRLGRQEEALKLGEQVLEGRRKVLGSDHADTLKVMEFLASSWFNIGWEKEAIQLSEEEVARQSEVSGPDHPATLGAKNGLAFYYAKTGRHGEAVQLAETVLVSCRARIGRDDAQTLAAMVRLAEVYGYADRRHASAALFEEVLPLLRGKFGPEHPIANDAATHLGRWYANWAWDGRATNAAAAREMAREAEKLLREALPVLESGTNTPPYHLACVRSRYGSALCAVAVTDPALTQAQREDKLAEAEKLMLQARVGISGDNLGCQRDALERNIRLYEAWSKPEKLAECKQKLDAFDLARATKQHTGR